MMISLPHTVSEGRRTVILITRGSGSHQALSWTLSSSQRYTAQQPSPYWNPASERHWPAFSLMKLNSPLIKIFLGLGIEANRVKGKKIGLKIVCENVFRKGTG